MHRTHTHMKSGIHKYEVWQGKKKIAGSNYRHVKIQHTKKWSYKDKAKHKNEVNKTIALIFIIQLSTQCAGHYQNSVYHQRILAAIIEPQY